jgi:hypothetical protein
VFKHCPAFKRGASKPVPNPKRRLTAEAREIERLNAHIAELESANTVEPTPVLTVDQHFAGLIDLLQDEPPKQLQQIMNNFGRRIKAAWEARRREGVPSRKPMVASTPDKPDAFQQVEDDLSAALTGALAAPKRKAKGKAAPNPKRKRAALKWNGNSAPTGDGEGYILESERLGDVVVYCGKLDPGPWDGLLKIGNAPTIEEAKAIAQRNHDRR